MLNNFQIVFPSLIQSTAYYFNANGAGRCALWSTLIWQEWGPDEPNYNELYYPANPGNSPRKDATRRTLPQELLGTVPAASNYLDIRVRLRRTKTPPNFLQQTPPIMFMPENQWINLPGGSCPTEYFAPMVRLFEIVRTGNNIHLRRFQSVRNSQDGYDVAPDGNPQRNLAVNESGWNSNAYSTNSEGLNPSTELEPRSNTQVAYLINQRSPGGRPNNSNQCAGNFPDLGSTYSADIIITPGYHKTS